MNNAEIKSMQAQPGSITQISRDNGRLLRGMHAELLKSLRRREQEIFSYLAILVPALTGFFLLLTSNNVSLFLIGSMGVILLLLLGSLYSLALGYNYRYITLQLAKIERWLSADHGLLEGWPKAPDQFRVRYSLWGIIPWCTPPAIIQVFWYAFLVGIIGVTAAASFSRPGICKFIVPFGACSFLGGALLGPLRFGHKLIRLCDQERSSWDAQRPDHESGMSESTPAQG